jgi:hypothetical protein
MDNTINSLVSKAVGVTDDQIKSFLASNPSDAQIVSAMQTYGVSPTQLANVVGVTPGEVIARAAATIPYGQTAMLGDVVVQPIRDVQGSGENEQVGPVTGINVTKSTGNISDKAPVGSQYQTYNPDGTLQGPGTVQKYDDKFSLGGVLKDIVSNPGFKIAALAYGGNALANALGGTGAGVIGSDLAGLSGIPAGAGALTAAEQAALYGTAGATGLPTAGAIGSDLAGLSGIPAGSGALTAAEQAALYGTGGASLGTIAGMGAGTGITAASAGGLGGASGAAGLGGSLGAGVGGVTAGGLAAGNSLLGGAALGSTLGSLGAGVGGSLLGSTIGSTLGNTVGSALGTTLGQGLSLSALGSGLGAAANQAGITEAKNLINQYGTQAGTNLATAYRDAQGLNAVNRADLGGIYKNTTGSLYDLYNKQVGIQQPYQDIGQAGSTGLLANQDYLTRQFNANDLNSNLAPNYAFQLNQGQMANQRAGNMSGGALGGNAMQGLQRYTQDYAGNAYQNAFNNFNTQRQNIFGNLSNMANIGTTSAGQLANLGNTLGGNLGSLSSNYAGNLTTGTGQGINAANAYGLNTANLATGIGGALASNATQSGANNASLLSNLGNTALLGSMLKAT